MAIGFCTSGSAAKTPTRNPGGTRHPAAAGVAGSRAVADRSVSQGGGNPSAAAAGDVIVVTARTTEYALAVRFMLGPGARVGIGEGPSSPAYRTGSRASPRSLDARSWRGRGAEGRMAPIGP